MRRILFLPDLARFSDASLLALRAVVGVFLMWETWDNISDAARMAEFVGFVGHFNIPAPEIAAPLSVYAQFLCGALFLLGLFTRWAGLLMVFNFIVALVFVHLDQSFREQFPALILIAVSLHFAASGGGRYSLDRVFE